MPSGWCPAAPGRAAAGRRRARRCARRSPSRTRRRARPGRPRRRTGSRAARRARGRRRARPCRRAAPRPRYPRCRRTFSTCVPSYSDSGLPPLAFFTPRKASPSSSAPASTSARSLWIARWLVEATPTVLPAASRRAISRPDVHVLPEPGGPLDDELAALEREQRARPSPRGRSFARRGRTGRGGGCSRPPRSGGCRGAASGRSARARPPGRRVRYGLPGISAFGSGTSFRLGPRLSFSVRASRSSSTISPARSPVAGSRTSCPCPSLCSCAGKVNA